MSETDFTFSIGFIECETCGAIAKQIKYAANSTSARSDAQARKGEVVQITEGFEIKGLHLASAVPDLIKLYRSPGFIARLEKMVGAMLLPYPDLDLGIQGLIMSTKKWQDRGYGCDGFTVWLFCSDLAVAEEGAFIAYNREGVDIAKIQPRTGTFVIGQFDKLEHEIEAPRRPAFMARLVYLDARKVSQKVIWGAMSPEARKVLVNT